MVVRNINAKSVSGLWVRLREDNKRYDVRYLNNDTRRMWTLNIGRKTTWGLTAKGVQYDDMLRSMKAGQYDTHGWKLVPELDYEMIGFKVSVPSPLYAKRVASMKLNEFDRGWTQKGENYVSHKVYAYPVPSEDMRADAVIEDSYNNSEDYDETVWDDDVDAPTTEELEEYYNDVADDVADTVEPEPVTQEIPEVPPTVNTNATVHVTIPTMMKAVDLPEFAGLGKPKVFRSEGRKVAYVAVGNGKCVIAYRDRYRPGADRTLEKALSDYVRGLGFEMAA